MSWTAKHVDPIPDDHPPHCGKCFTLKGVLAIGDMQARTPFRPVVYLCTPCADELVFSLREDDFDLRLRDALWTHLEDGYITLDDDDRRVIVSMGSMEDDREARRELGEKLYEVETALEDAHFNITRVEYDRVPYDTDIGREIHATILLGGYQSEMKRHIYDIRQSFRRNGRSILAISCATPVISLVVATLITLFGDMTTPQIITLSLLSSAFLLTSYSGICLWVRQTTYTTGYEDKSWDIGGRFARGLALLLVGVTVLVRIAYNVPVLPLAP